MGLIFKLENEENHFQGELGKIFYVRIVVAYFLNFNGSTGCTRMSVPKVNLHNFGSTFIDFSFVNVFDRKES